MNKNTIENNSEQIELYTITVIETCYGGILTKQDKNKVISLVQEEFPYVSIKNINKIVNEVFTDYI